MIDRPSRLRRFTTELRRRKVLRVIAAYGLVALGIAEAANNVLPPLGVEWGPTVVVVLLLVGFPVIVALSWIFDITPRGIERTPDEPSFPGSSGTGMTGIGGAPLPAGSIAALPLVNLSGDPAHDYLSDGLTEEMIVALSRVPALRVAARTSCFATKGWTDDVRTIGRRLGVRHVIEGGLRTWGNRLRLSVQLIDVETGYAEWSETYEREIDDLFAVQSEVAHAVVERITAGSREATAAVGGPGTQNLEAFHLLLRGRHHWNRRTEPDLRKAIEFFERAIEVDPEFARAWAGLADAIALLLDYGAIAWADGLPRAREAAERALHIDDGLAEAWTSLALVREFEWRWQDADRCFRRSIELRPDYAVAHQRFALHKAWLRLPDEAIRHARTAEELDPLSVSVATSTAFVLYYARRFDDAKTQTRKAIEMDGSFPTARVAHALVCMQTGEAGESVIALQHAVQAAGSTVSVQSLMTCALARAGRTDEAGRERTRMEAPGGRVHVSGYYRALPALALGDVDAATDALEAACDEHSPQMAYIGAEPLLDDLRGSERFDALLRRTGLAHGR